MPTQGKGTVSTQAQLVRQWATDQGYTVSNRGKIPPDVWDAYANAHPGFEREAPVGEWNCPTCGRQWTGTRECHCTQCHRHFSTVDGFDAHRPDLGCLDPVGIRIRGNPLCAKQSVWGTIYVREMNSTPAHWNPDSQIALGDASDLA